MTVAEDATHTFTTTASDWGFVDVDSGDAMTSVDITSLPATGTLNYGGSAVEAGDDIAIANLGGLTYVPVANANGAVTFTPSCIRRRGPVRQRGHIHPDLHCCE